MKSLFFYLITLGCFIVTSLGKAKSDQFTDFLEFDQDNEELLTASQNVYLLFEEIHQYNRTERIDLIYQIGRWIDQNDFDSAAFALVTLNEILETEKYDSVLHPVVNYQIGQLYLNTGQFLKAEERITQSVAGSFLLKDSVYLSHSYLLLANINLKLNQPYEVDRFLRQYLKYDRKAALQQEYKVTLLGYQLLTQSYDEAEVTVNEIDLSQIQKTYYIGSYLLFARIVAVYRNDNQLDQRLADSLNFYTTTGSLLIARIKNAHFDSFKRNQLTNPSDYLNIVLDMPDYGITISKEAIHNGVVMYSACLFQYLSQKRRRNKYIIVSVLVLIIGIIGFIITLRNRRIKSLETENKETISVSNILLSQYNGYFNQINEIILDDPSNAVQKIKFEQDKFKRQEKQIKKAVKQSHFLSPQLVNSLMKLNEEINVNDIKLASLILMQLDNHEIAAILGISPDATRKRKQRLKNKLNVENEEQLLALLIRMK